jgi:uncharacterized protein (TIGR02757 family)
MAEVRALLESAYADFHSTFYRDRDPVCLVHPFADPRDREVAGLFTALLSYGNVTTILASVRRALAPLGPSPARTLLQGGDFRLWPGFRHRFTTGDELRILALWLSSALKSHGSLEAFFLAPHSGERPEMRVMLGSFIDRLTAQALPQECAELRERRERQLKYLLPHPDRGSACKRLNMYLRWMVRSDGAVDLGVWRGLTPAELALPVDTHLLKTLRLLRWTRSKQASWKVVEAATKRLRDLCPEDPIRYDFSLCHLSMEGHTLKKARR